MNVGFSIKSIGLFLKLHRAVKEEKKKNTLSRNRPFCPEEERYLPRYFCRIFPPGVR